MSDQKFKFTEITFENGKEVRKEIELDDPDGKLNALSVEQQKFWDDQEKLAGDCDHDAGIDHYDNAYFCQKCGACLQVG